ncbi:MAG TPA: sulfite exporter TauE/SafE family protein [Acidimicrobiia bacterium]|nr:sulfite exporter TauE/SafE family protein [Acidimicrobiia bacterium]
MEPWVFALVLVAAAVSFTVSASAGLGGSLVLVPSLALALGTKEGVALAALLLAANNVVKVFAYRETLPFRKALLVIILVAVGAALGARLLVAAPDQVVTLAVIASFVFALVAERLDLSRLRRVEGPVLAFGSGATSGFSGTSGPLKGMALRQLDLDRAHFVGAASLVSLVGDATKAAVFTEAELLGAESFVLALAAVPLMLVATFTGRRINRRIGERGYTFLFWGVMTGYTARLLLSL